MPGRTQDEGRTELWACRAQSGAKRIGLGADCYCYCCLTAMIYGRNGFLMTTTTTAACTNYKPALTHTHTEIVIDQDLRCVAAVR